MSHLIVIDAIDGAGKSTAIKAMAEALQGRGLKVFDVVAHMRDKRNLPEYDDPEIQSADVLLTAEPTHCWVGAAIREEIVKANNHRPFGGLVTAQAFSLDRLVLFTRLILPFLQNKPQGWVIQDRGCITSLAYQPLQDPRVTLDWLLTLEGNKLELSRPPELMLLLRLAAATAMERISGRTDKIDNHIFENLPFQEKLTARYRDPQVLAPYRDAGTKIVEIDASQPPDLVAADACRELAALIG